MMYRSTITSALLAGLCVVGTTGCPAPVETASIVDTEVPDTTTTTDTTTPDANDAGTPGGTPAPTAPTIPTNPQTPPPPPGNPPAPVPNNPRPPTPTEPVPTEETPPVPDGPTPPVNEGINPRSQLMVTDLRVVEDPVRTNAEGEDAGVWTFRYLIEQMSGLTDPSDFTLAWLEHWESDQTINGFTARARPAIGPRLIDPWLAASGGEKLDLAKAPFKLLAIVNRIDLRVHDGDEVVTGGEGRFVFGALAPDGRPLPPTGPGTGGFLVIFEYEYVATDVDALRGWAEAWDGLRAHPIGSADYNAALEAITRRFTDSGAAPGKVHGNALNQIRTNDQAFGRIWELREFALSAETGLLAERTVALTPDVITLNGTAEFAAIVNDGEAALLSGEGELVPEYFAASALSGPFRPEDFPNFAERTFTLLPGNGGGQNPPNPPGPQGPPPPNQQTMQGQPGPPPPPPPNQNGPQDGPERIEVAWNADGINSNEARHALAINTCNGCHRSETRINFTMVNFANEPDRPAQLSGFLRGMDVADPVDPATVRHFDDLERRRVDLEELLAALSAKSARALGRHVPNFVH